MIKLSTFIGLLFLVIVFSSCGQTQKCDALDLMKLQNKKIQDDFLNQLDSIRKVQYPNNDQETEIMVDIDRKLLTQFLKDIDQAVLSKNKNFEKEYHFNIAPKEYSDTEKCNDKISVEYYPEECSYRMVIWNSFLFEENGCTESTVVYGFSIQNDKIIDFSRNVAG